MPAQQTAKSPKWLTSTDVPRLRKLRAGGEKVRVLAEQFRITPGAVSRIVNGHRRAVA